jgi:preprotein translocase subunit SecF
MNKRLKITLYIVLILAVIVVIWLMFWNTNPDVEIQSDTDIEISNEEKTIDLWDNTTNYGNNNSFEEDVMKDLEWFFEGNNGYEDVQWEFWFTNPEDE